MKNPFKQSLNTVHVRKLVKHFIDFYALRVAFIVGARVLYCIIIMVVGLGHSWVFIQ